uniref:Uncharacterized protein n=1 Tax=Hippocampus comes TaxID=109280 RepID=A0A3Q2YBA4_HIPCM
CHEERKGLQEEAKSNLKNRYEQETSDEDAVEQDSADPEETKAATVLQSNFRGHQERPSIKPGEERHVCQGETNQWLCFPDVQIT